MIKVRNVNFKIAGKPILQNINLDIPEKQTTALIGPNGAGKSTLLSLMARLNTIQTGQVLYDDLDLTKAKSNVIAKRVSLLQQRTQFMSRLTVDELLIFARYPYHKGRPKAEDHAHKERVIEYFELKPYQDRFIDELSGGQQQMALVGMVFCQDTDYVLLDEPLNNLDIFHARHLMRTLKHAIEDWGKTVVIVMHDINYAAHYADRIIALNKGSVMFEGQTAQALTAKNISSLYNIEVDMIEHKGQPICLHF